MNFKLVYQMFTNLAMDSFKKIFNLKLTENMIYKMELLLQNFHISYLLIYFKRKYSMMISKNHQHILMIENLIYKIFFFILFHLEKL